MNKFRVMVTAYAKERTANGAAVGLHMKVLEHDTLEEAESAVRRVGFVDSEIGVRYEAVRLYTRKGED